MHDQITYSLSDCNSCNHFNYLIIVMDRVQLFICVLWIVAVTNAQQPLRFNPDGTFKIATLADLHYGEGPGSDWGPRNDLKSVNVTTDILAWEQPDFVVFTGDLMSAEVMFPNGSAVVDQLLGPLVAGNYKWASTYGNHDIGNNVTREEILAAEQKHTELCYTQKGRDGLEGTTNYYVPIYGSQWNGSVNDAPAVILWFFDSRGGRNSSGGIPAFVHESVVNWFTQEEAAMTNRWGRIPSLAFFHYPTAEYSPIHDDIDNHPECPGQHDDIVTPQERDSGLMAGLVNSGTVRAAFVGHNHGNGWCCYYRTVDLCYNRQSGHGGGWVGWVRGSRIITLQENDLWSTIKSYIRLENSNIVDHFPRQNITETNNNIELK